MPWYLVGDLSGYPFGEAGSGLGLGLAGRAAWLLPFLVPLGIATLPLLARSDREMTARRLVLAGLLGLAWLIVEGFAIGHRGWSAAWLADLFGGPGPRQGGMGFGAALVGLAFLMLLCHGLAARAWCRGDVFVVASIALVVALIALFVFFPVTTILASAFQDKAGGFSPAAFLDKFTESSVWGLDCLSGGLRCGVAWNTLFLAVAVGIGSTVLGLAFALIATRTNFRHKGALRILTVLPIITPIAILALTGGVQDISPSLEKASQTVRAKGWTTVRTISLPLMRPGLANAFLLGFIESMADFGNPLVLGGNFEVLSTKIFFAVVGAAHDQGRAAVLSIVLLGFTLAAFFVQYAWLGKRVYTTVTGKGDSGLPLRLPRGIAWLCYGVAIPWAAFTFVVYAIILVGGFVRAMGRDYTVTLEHYLTGFRIEQTARGLFFSGSAWDSFAATLKVVAIAAPLTAAVGLLTAYLLTRQNFSGRRAFEFGTMLSFAIPGTVVGVSYILAFNVPPIEITGTAFVLVMCFVFRNMPVAVRSGIATMSQIDKSLDEASLTLGARSFATVRRVILPLLRPAVVAALVYSFVRAMTAVSAVIFLVTAEYNMATTYIVGRVEAGEFGLAIAYSSVLIAVMLVAILLIQLAVGERRLGRRDATAVAPAGTVAAAG